MRENKSPPSKRSLRLIGFGILLGLYPLLGIVDLFILLLFITLLFWRLVYGEKPIPFELPLRLGILLGGGALLFGQYGQILGLEPGLGLFLLLFALKLAEARRDRDWEVVALLGWFLCLCGLFARQDLLIALIVLGALALISAGLMAAHTNQALGLRIVGLFLGAIPVIVVLFLFVPRPPHGFRVQMGEPRFSGMGLSEEMNPGSISSIALSEEVAFRVSILNGRTPYPSEMYWRAGILYQCGGLTWRFGTPLPLYEDARQHRQESLVQQRIIMEPHGGRWMPALDRPLAGDRREAMLEPGNVLVALRPVQSTLRYHAISSTEIFRSRTRGEVLAPALRVPDNIPQRVRELANQLRGETFQETKEALLDHFRTGGFTYSLNPGPYDGPDGLESFLFDRKQGFCEHYSATFATLARLAGIPSRIVIGYHGGEWNALGDYYVVRQSDAHAWCELWEEGVGWQRIDPTALVEPDRIRNGMAAVNDLARRVAPGSSGEAWSSFLRNAHMLWDNLDYQWNINVFNFDAEAQREFFSSIGLATIGRHAYFALPILLAVAALLHALRRPRRLRPSLPDDVAGEIYGRLLLEANRCGLKKPAYEGPIDFLNRLSALHPKGAPWIEAFQDQLITLRYGPGPHRKEAFHKLHLQAKRCCRLLRQI